ncbi:hypothetical protein [Streptomyces sp. NPDC058045]|uniref:hypothetical protein n=1 Tax=Streptomyces sp. NPDC058045 TaxID=3346311 RepID=UPI0036E0EDE3
MELLRGHPAEVIAAQVPPLSDDLELALAMLKNLHARLHAYVGLRHPLTREVSEVRGHFRRLRREERRADGTGNSLRLFGRQP